MKNPYYCVLQEVYYELEHLCRDYNNKVIEHKYFADRVKDIVDELVDLVGIEYE